MSYLFGRRCSVELVSKTGVVFDITNNEIRWKKSRLGYENFRIVFEVTKTLTKTPDKAVVSIYNIIENDWKADDFKKNQTKLILKATYDGIDADIVFSGEITNFEKPKERTDVISYFTCGSGFEVLTKSNINKSYKSGMSIADIIDDVVKEVKKTGAEIAGDVKKKLAEIKAEGTKADSGLSVSGLLSSTLSTLLKPFNKEFTIQDDVLKIVEIGQETATTTPVLLTPSTGLIGSPTKTKDGLEFTALIQPGKFNPGQFVQIKSRDFKGTYKIIKATFSGDTHGNDWYVKGLCI